MGCSHNFVYTQGYFVCTKCGKRSYGRSHKKSQGKKIGVGVGIGILLLAVIFVAYSGIFQINKNTLESTFENISSEMSKVDIDLPKIQPLEEVEKIVPKIQQEIPKMQEATKQVIKSELNITKIETLIHQKVNQERKKLGLSSLTYDNQISNIARAHSQDMAKNNYFEHTSLSGKEPWDRGFAYGYNVCGTLEAIALQERYDKLPKTTSSEYAYQQAMSIYRQLNIKIQNDELFGGLGENIFQNWTYSSITYVNGIPIYDWNTEEEIAQQTVDGWMNSDGHRENILSSFHSEGIGVAVGTDDKVLITQDFC